MTSIESASAVLQRQPLVKRGYAWQAERWNRFPRTFSHHTIKRLLTRGLARRIGNRVVALSFDNDNRPA